MAPPAVQLTWVQAAQAASAQQARAHAVVETAAIDWMLSPEKATFWSSDALQ